KASSQIDSAQDGWGKGPTFGDVDNDGDLDLYEGDCKLANQLYINDGKGNFKNIAADQPQLQCATVRTKGTAFADIDNDGDLDLYVINWGAENKLYKNTQNDGNWIKLAGLPMGARVALYDGDQLIASREVKSATGFCAQEPAVAHFGVVAGKSYTAKITAPGGAVQSVTVKAGQFTKVN
ncbi:MAG: CRTAC1 family protein, partial [Desulfuromonadales bacterium]|nr:CRTAC1 family protein [Desulfuromonadales bacterium]